MSQSTHRDMPLVESVRQAITSRYLEAFGSLLDDDVRRGSDDQRVGEAVAELVHGIICAECGCIINQGVRIFTCGNGKCCCRGLPVGYAASS